MRQYLVVDTDAPDKNEAGPEMAKVPIVAGPFVRYAPAAQRAEEADGYAVIGINRD
jgi:hypothetical protein